MGSSEAVEATDGNDVHFTERLSPPWWVWLIGAFLGAPLAVAYGAAFGAPAGWVVYAVFLAILVAFLIASAPVVRVDGLVLRAGRARLPVRFVGTLAALDADRMRTARGQDGHANAYLVIRTWYSKVGILVEVDDESDPHPYWLVSTRDPERLLASLRGSIERARRVEPADDTEERP